MVTVDVSTKEHIDFLTMKLNDACKAYYVDSKPIMPDKVFDELYDELVRLEKETGYSLPESPTHNVGWHEVVKDIPEVEISHPMLSLDKCHTVEELIKFSGNNDCFLSVKADGLSTTLNYENGKLQSAVTRGNGIIGNDVTHNAQVIKSIPKTINYKGHLIIDGETIIDYETFNKINEPLPEDKKYRHPRNLASASLLQQDNQVAKERNMKFVAWKVIEGLDDISSHHFKLNKADELGFVTAPRLTYCANVKDNLSDMLEKIKQMAVDEGIPCDGAVMSIDNVDKAANMGRTEKYFLNAIAYKYEDEMFETVLEDITWQTSKTGLMNPVGVFKEVDLDGALTTRCTLHNPEYIEGLQLGIGDRILVRRANQVIPRCEDNLDRSGTYKLPTTCSCCGGKAELRKEGKSKMLYCTNPNCQSKLVGLLTHAVSRDALNIDGLSEATIEFLVDKGWIKSIKDLYHLDKYKDRWSTYTGFGKRSVEKTLTSIESSRNTDLVRFLYCLSIPQVGKTASKEINKLCKGDFDFFINHVPEVRNMLTNTPGYGSAISYSMKDYFNKNMDMVIELAKEFTFKQQTNTTSGSKFKGINFAITGSVKHFKNRKEIQEIIESNCGKVVSGVSKTTHYLINNDKESNSSKNVSAKKYGTTIISEQDFLELLK